MLTPCTFFEITTTNQNYNESETKLNIAKTENDGGVKTSQPSTVKQPKPKKQLTTSDYVICVMVGIILVFGNLIFGIYANTIYNSPADLVTTVTTLVVSLNLLLALFIYGMLSHPPESTGPLIKRKFCEYFTLLFGPILYLADQCFDLGVIVQLYNADQSIKERNLLASTLLTSFVLFRVVSGVEVYFETTGSKYKRISFAMQQVIDFKFYEN